MSNTDLVNHWRHFVESACFASEEVIVEERRKFAYCWWLWDRGTGHRWTNQVIVLPRSCIFSRKPFEGLGICHFGLVWWKCIKESSSLPSLVIRVSSLFSFGRTGANHWKGQPSVIKDKRCPLVLPSSYRSSPHRVEKNYRHLRHLAHGWCSCVRNQQFATICVGDERRGSTGWEMGWAVLRESKPGMQVDSQSTIGSESTDVFQLKHLSEFGLNVVFVSPIFPGVRLIMDLSEHKLQHLFRIMNSMLERNTRSLLSLPLFFTYFIRNERSTDTENNTETSDQC